MKKSILLLSAIILCSCASRKVNTEINKTESKSELTEVVKEETSTNTENKKESVTTDKTTINSDISEVEEDVKAIDPLKPITKTVTKDGNTTKTVWENANVTSKTKSDKSVSNIHSDKKETASQTESINQKLESEIRQKEETNIKTKSKQTEVVSLWWLLLLLIPLGYWIYRKYIV